MHDAVTVATADPAALPATENDPEAVIDAVALAVASPSTMIRAADDVLDDTETDPDAIRTLVAADVVDASPADVVWSGPCP
jgi:hypothetical protein